MSKGKRDVLEDLIRKDPSRAVHILLETSFWVSGIDVSSVYRRNSDDTDGNDKGIKITFSEDGDGWIEIFSYNFDRETGEILSDDGHHRFRTYRGGGRSQRTRTALMILARAIELDNQENPDRHPR